MSSSHGLRFMLLVLAWAGITSAAEPTAMNVSLAIFSGRPDPKFTITDPVALRQIATVLTVLPPHPTYTAANPPAAPGLGYGGFRVTPVGVDGISSFTVYGSIVEVTSTAGARSYRYDGDAELESRLMNAARDQHVAGVSAAAADTIVVGTGVAERTLTLNFGPVLYTLVPLPLKAPVTCVAGTRVKLVATPSDAATALVRWVKDSRVLPTTGSTVEFVAGAADSGRYWAIVGPENGPSTSTASIDLFVTNREGQRLLNLSVLGRIGAEQPMLRAGFVVELGAAGSRALLLVRAVGPGLAPLGVPGTLRTPELQVYDATGALVPPAAMPFVLPTVTEATQRTGAFTLPVGSTDVARLYLVPGGAFTATVASADAGTGAVLLEVYEVPL